MSTLGDELLKKIALLEKQRVDFNADIDRQLSVYRAALAAEQSTNGTRNTADSTFSEMEETGDPGLPSREANTGFVRELINRRAKKGITAGGIREAAASRGFVLTKKFPYRILWKLQNQNEIIRDETGLYYPAPLPESAAKS
jgi:hypothetical protein